MRKSDVGICLFLPQSLCHGDYGPVGSPPIVLFIRSVWCKILPVKASNCPCCEWINCGTFLRSRSRRSRSASREPIVRLQISVLTPFVGFLRGDSGVGWVTEIGERISTKVFFLTCFSFALMAAWRRKVGATVDLTSCLSTCKKDFNFFFTLGFTKADLRFDQGRCRALLTGPSSTLKILTCKMQRERMGTKQINGRGCQLHKPPPPPRTTLVPLRTGCLRTEDLVTVAKFHKSSYKSHGASRFHDPAPQLWDSCNALFRSGRQTVRPRVCSVICGDEHYIPAPPCVVSQRSVSVNQWPHTLENIQRNKNSWKQIWETPSSFIVSCCVVRHANRIWE